MRRLGLFLASAVAVGAVFALWPISPWASRSSAPPSQLPRTLPLQGAPNVPAQAPPTPPHDTSTFDDPGFSRFTGPPRRQRGVALGLFAEDIGFSYAPLLTEIAALGATHVALIVPVYQNNGSSTALYFHTRFSPTLDAVAEAVRVARQQQLEVTLFPIVRLEHPASAQEWRGTLAPANTAHWFASYSQVLGSLAAVGSLTGATRLVVGSELSTLDGLKDHWQPLLDRIRAVFPGTLLYSANWDHFEDASLFDLVDEAGVTGYFSLRAPEQPSDVEALEKKWRALRTRLETWARARRQPWLFTELGYRSRTGATASPWDETPGGSPNPEEQARGFEAFARAWSDSSTLAGFYIWNWYGYGGPTTSSYTPRGKPAADVVRRLLSGF